MILKTKIFKPKYNENFLLKEEIKNIIENNNFSYQHPNIPWLVWLLENPQSRVALPGKITLYNHDCLHILLDRGFTLADEAFVVGFAMGNDSETKWYHVLIFKLFSAYLYPIDYRFNRNHFIVFQQGFDYGRKVKVKDINKIDFQASEQVKTIKKIREEWGNK